MNIFILSLLILLSTNVIMTKSQENNLKLLFKDTNGRWINQDHHSEKSCASGQSLQYKISGCEKEHILIAISSAGLQDAMKVNVRNGNVNYTVSQYTPYNDYIICNSTPIELEIISNNYFFSGDYIVDIRDADNRDEENNGSVNEHNSFEVETSSSVASTEINESNTLRLMFKDTNGRWINQGRHSEKSCSSGQSLQYKISGCEKLSQNSNVEFHISSSGYQEAMKVRINSDQHKNRTIESIYTPHTFVVECEANLEIQNNNYFLPGDYIVDIKTVGSTHKSIGTKLQTTTTAKKIIKPTARITEPPNNNTCKYATTRTPMAEYHEFDKSKSQVEYTHIYSFANAVNCTSRVQTNYLQLWWGAKSVEDIRGMDTSDFGESHKLVFIPGANINSYVAIPPLYEKLVCLIKSEQFNETCEQPKISNNTNQISDKYVMYKNEQYLPFVPSKTFMYIYNTMLRSSKPPVLLWDYKNSYLLVPEVLPEFEELKN